MHQLMLPLHHTSMILQHKSLVHHPLEVLKVLGFQSIGQTIIQSNLASSHQCRLHAEHSKIVE
jgi:hypothetical protein